MQNFFVEIIHEASSGCLNAVSLSAASVAEALRIPR